MLKRIREEQGFTLIELLVVILIIAILIAVAAPSFLGQQDKAHKSGMKQQLAVAYKAAKADAVDREGDFGTTGDVVNAITQSEPQLADKVAAGDDFPAAADAGDINVEVTDSTVTLRGLAKGGDEGQEVTATFDENGAYTISK